MEDNTVPVIKKKITKRKRKPLKLLARKRITPPVSTDIVSPPKFLQVYKFFHLYGDVSLFDHSPIAENGEGVLSIINFYCNVKEVGIDRERNFISVKLDKFKQFPNNWRLLTYRLRTLSDVDAKILADKIEVFSSGIEDQRFELRRLAQLAAGERRKGRGPKKLTSDILQDNKEYLEEEQTQSPAENETQPEDNEEELSTYSQELEEEQYHTELGEFIKSLHLKYFVSWQFQRDILTGDVCIRKMRINKRLVELLGYTLESMAFLMNRSGIPEFVSSRDYFRFMGALPLLRDFKEISYPSLIIDFIDSTGRTIPGFLKRDFIFSKRYKKRELNTVVIEFEVEKFVEEAVANRGQAKMENPPTMQEMLGYKLLYEEFYEHFYPGTSLVPENMKVGRESKICGYKLLKD